MTSDSASGNPQTLTSKKEDSHVRTLLLEQASRAHWNAVCGMWRRQRLDGLDAQGNSEHHPARSRRAWSHERANFIATLWDSPVHGHRLLLAPYRVVEAADMRAYLRRSLNWRRPCGVFLTRNPIALRESRHCVTQVEFGLE